MREVRETAFRINVFAVIESSKMTHSGTNKARVFDTPSPVVGVILLRPKRQD